MRAVLMSVHPEPQRRSVSATIAGSSPGSCLARIRWALCLAAASRASVISSCGRIAASMRVKWVAVPTCRPGPSGPASIAAVKQMGAQAWLNQQYSMPPTPLPQTTDMNALRNGWYANMANAPDQVRQRMIFALSQLFVVSSDKNNNANYANKRHIQKQIHHNNTNEHQNDKNHNISNNRDYINHCLIQEKKPIKYL